MHHWFMQLTMTASFDFKNLNHLTIVTVTPWLGKICYSGWGKQNWLRSSILSPGNVWTPIITIYQTTATNISFQWNLVTNNLHSTPVKSHKCVPAERSCNSNMKYNPTRPSLSIHPASQSIYFFWEDLWHRGECQCSLLKWLRLPNNNNIFNSENFDASKSTLQLDMTPTSYCSVNIEASNK